MTVRTTHRRAALTLASAALAATSLAGCSDEPGDAASPDPGTSSPAADPASAEDEAMTFEQVSDDLDRMVGDEVRVRARVEGIVTPGVFTVNALEGNDLESIVVVGEDTARDLALDDVVVIEATVEPSLAPNRVARLLDVQLDDEMLTDYRGDPYLGAADVAKADA